MSIILNGVNGKDGTLRPGAFGTATLVVPDRGVGALVSVSIVQQRLQRLAKALEAAQAQKKRDAKKAARLAQQAAHQTKVGRGLPKHGDGTLGGTGGGGGGTTERKHEQSHFGIFDFLVAGAAMAFGKRVLGTLVGRFGNLLKLTGSGVAAIIRPKAALSFMTKMASGLGKALSFANPMVDIALLPTLTTTDEDKILDEATRRENEEIAKIGIDAWEKKYGKFTSLKSAWAALSKATFEYTEDIKTWVVQQSQAISTWLSDKAGKLRAALANFDLKTLLQEWLGKIKEWVGGIHVSPADPNNTPPSQMSEGDLARNRAKDNNFRRDPETYKNDPSRVGGSKATESTSGAPLGAVGDAKPIPVKTGNGIEMQDPNNMSGQAVAGGEASEGIKSFARIMAGSTDLPGGFQEITSLNDAYHAGTNSKHAQGLAADFTLKDGSRQSYEAANEYIRNRLKASGLRDDQFWIEPTSQTSGAGSTAPHVHVQFQSAADADQFAQWAKTDPDAQKAMKNASDATIKPNPAGLFPNGNFTGRVGTSKPVSEPKNALTAQQSFDYYGPHSAKNLIEGYSPEGFQNYGVTPKRTNPLSDTDLTDFLQHYTDVAHTDENGLTVAQQGEVAYKKAKEKWARMNAPSDVSPPTTTISETLPTISQDQMRGSETATSMVAVPQRRRATMDDIPSIHPDANLTVHHHSDNY